jgi:tRNA A22 N-methylase
VVLAGMGGHTIARILSTSPEAVRTLGWLVLQPQQNPFQLSAWLNGAGFHTLAAEQAVDRGRWYTVLLVKPPDDGS